MITDAWSVVVVLFPFSEQDFQKPRPAVVLSESSYQSTVGQTILAMITSGKRSHWPFDTPVTDLAAAGLTRASRVRARIATVDNELIAHHIGTLAVVDREAVAQSLRCVVTW